MISPRTLFITLSILLTTIPAAAFENSLLNHPSPYLALHGNDPVDWQEWNADVLTKAKAENKPILLSIGYFSCNWCHVMQRESYQDEDIAALLNEKFVSIKVDRELQPALDDVMIAFVEGMNGVAGWPLNVFLTPEGLPLAGIVYMPPEGFTQVLQAVAEQWRQNPKQVRLEAQSGLDTFNANQPPADNSKPPNATALAELFQNQALAVGDELSGGFGDQSKFPSVPQLLALVDLYRAKPDPSTRGFLELTLHNMATQGLRDQLAGGFFRYTVDPTWQTPHFEKMLYSNALLAELYIRAADALSQPVLERVAEDTLNFMQTELAAANGGMISSLSAVDEEDVEGAAYVWTPEAMERLLTEKERQALGIIWGMEGQPQIEGGYLPRKSDPSLEQAGQQLGTDRAGASALFESARKKLLAEHKKRIIPRDDKVLAGWNGLTLSAYAQAVTKSWGEPHRATGKSVRDYLVNTLWDGKRLMRARSAQGELGNATIEDYAFVARGLADWADATDSEVDRKIASQIVESAWRQFFDPGKGWRKTETMLVPMSISEPILPDGALPSSSATLIDVSLRLATHLKEPLLYSKALQALRLNNSALETSPFFYASHVSAALRAGEVY